MYKKSSSENQDKGFGENCLNQISYDWNSEKKGKHVELHLLVLL